MDKRQFNLKDLPVRIDEVIDEVDGETVLTLVSNGDHGVTGYLMLKAEEAFVRWEWRVSEPEAISTIAGVEDALWDAAKRVRVAMRDMVEILTAGDGS